MKMWKLFTVKIFKLFKRPWSLPPLDVITFYYKFSKKTHKFSIIFPFKFIDVRPISLILLHKNWLDRKLKKNIYYLFNQCYLRCFEEKRINVFSWNFSSLRKVFLKCGIILIKIIRWTYLCKSFILSEQGFQFNFPNFDWYI